jgi:hypothetical protein
VSYEDNNFDAINGGWYDGDGFGSGRVAPGTGTSCWYSPDPFANSGACGPGQNGQNFAYGWNSGNSSGSSSADVNVNIVGGQFNGFGGGAIKIYGCQNCKVTGTSINHPNAAVFTPIAYGPFVIGGVTHYPTNNEISNNTAFWSPTTGAVVSEDATYAPFSGSVVNIVRNNICIGSSGNACYELAKDNNSSTTSGPIVTHSVTSQAHGIVDTFQQTEGTGSSSWAFSEYANIGGTGTLFRSCNFSFCLFPEELQTIGFNYIATENGANNAIAGSLPSVPLTQGMTVTMILQHSLQAGANTFAYNGTSPLAIVQHVNPANNLTVGYSIGASITLLYDGTRWQDLTSMNTAGGGGGGTVTAVTATAPLMSSGGTTPNIFGTYNGTGSKIQLFTGSTTTNDCVKFDSNGNVVDAGVPCGAPSTTPFSSLSSSTNTTAAMVVGSGSSLTASGGTISATNTTAVNSGTIPTSATVLGSNSSNQIVTATVQGNGSKVQLSTGTTTTGHCTQFDANGNTVDSGSACGSGSSNPPFNTLTSGTNTTAAMVVGSGANLSATGSGTISATNTTAVNSGAIAANVTVLATNSSSQLVAATYQGNGAKAQLSTGTTVVNDCVKFDANGNTVDAGSPCGSVGAAPFNIITSGTNTTAAMVVGSGSSMTASGTGSIVATNTTGVNGAAVPATATALASNASHQIVAASLHGNGANVQLETGTTTSGHCAQFDANGNVVDAGGVCGGTGSVAFSAITSGTNTTGAMLVGTGASLAATGSGTITATNTTGVNGAVVPTSAKVVASNGSSQLIAATLQGNGTKVQLSTGTTTTNDCAKFDANGNVIDAGVTCGTGSTFGFINVLSLGAVGDGVTDNGPILQSYAATVGTGTATLYFPTGNYYFSANGPVGSEESVRWNGSISMFGDGPGRTIITTNSSSSATAVFGWVFRNTGIQPYTYEQDSPPGGTSGLVNLATATMGSALLTMTTSGDATSYTAGMWVYVRGASCCSSGQYHGELNQIAVNGSGGVIQLLWPLSSDYTSDTGLRVNQVLSSEIIKNVFIQGMTFNVYKQAMVGAQILGLKMTNLEFNYTGTTQNGIFQWNQCRKVEFSRSIINTYQSSGNALDPARNPTDWDIFDNTINGSMGPGEMGANVRIHHNTHNCTNIGTTTAFECISIGNTTNTLVDNNTVYYWDTSTGTSNAAIYDSTGGNSPGVVISNNKISSNIRAIQAATPGTLIVGNHIDTQSTGIDIQTNNVSAFNNTVHATGTGTYGCVLIEGTNHGGDIVDGLNCYGQSGLLGYAAVLIGDEGAQTDQAIITNVHGNYLQSGVNIFNTAHDAPLVDMVYWSNVTTPYPGGGVETIYRCGTSGVLYSATGAPAGCGTSVDTGHVGK